MELWNDYEGKVLDGRYRLDRLIGPKGRSAFFTTTQDGEPATIRVIESLNDEDEILARWNAVRTMNETSLVTILACNKTILDGVHLVYAVLEATDADLADLLRERPLSPEETREMAASVVTALEALHANGLIHEHVEAESVLAKGEAVKLRGDCVREAPDGVEGETLRRRDAHDLAMLVGYSLTQRRDLGQARLPRPFDDLVRNGMSGTWGLKEMAGVVRPVSVITPPAATGPSVAAPPVPMTTGGVPSRPGPVSVPVRSAERLQPPAGDPAKTSARAVAASLARPAADSPQVPTRRVAADDRIVLEPETNRHSRSVFWAALAVAAIVLISLIWHFTHAASTPAAAATPAAEPVAAAPLTTGQQPALRSVAPAQKPSAATRRAEAGQHVSVSRGAGPAGTQWRLIAFTFNRQEQAQRKAEELAQRRPSLKPEVFTPSGHAPYLVALGGWMSADQASAFKAKARVDGLPRDMYTQNFHSR